MLRRKLLALLFAVVCCSGFLTSQSTPSANSMRDLLSTRPVNRILLPISNDERVVLGGQRHPMARAEYSIGTVAPELYMGRMMLMLRSDPAQDAALEELIRAQQDPGSSYYHHWLTPEQFGKRFGVSPHDSAQVVNWLESFGMSVEEIPASRRAIVFSGTAAQVENAFHVNMQRYLVKGVTHLANANDPEIPQALATVVRGVVALHDFRSVPLHVVAPQYTAGNGTHYLMPADWVTIYDAAPLYNRGLTGTGQSIAVLGRVDVALSDVRTFRTNAGLPANDPQLIVNGPDPGFPDCDDEAESALDVEWAGAIAKNATIKFVTSQSGAAGDGISLSAQYAVNHNVAPIVSLSYGLCEGALGSGGNAFWNSTWQQAAAQGMSVFVSSGDNGAAGCDSPSETTATQGRSVNGLCSSPYSTCVGGTQFNDTYNPGEYWSSTNGSGQSSALSYIPELAWNESSWSGGLWAGGGGASIVYSKPAWQAAAGVPADGKRDVPDVSGHASIQEAYIIQIQGSTFYVSGTSAATPSLASVMALVTQISGGAQGNANPVLYAMANQASSEAAFHDVTNGNNSVPGVNGFTAGTGYDEATGLGTVDASAFVNAWSSASQSGFTLSPSVASVSLTPGTSKPITLSLIAQSGFHSVVTLSATGAPSGVTVKFSSSTVTAALPVTVTIAATGAAATSNSTITISGSGGGVGRSTSITAAVVAPTFTLSPGASSVTVTAGTPSTLTLTTAAVNGFKSAISLSVAGLPAGVTASFAPSSIASPGNGKSTVTLAAGSAAVAAATTFTLKGTAGGVTQTQTISLTVVVPTFTLTASAPIRNVTAGSSANVGVTTVGLSGFKSAVLLSISGLPKGVTAKFSPASIASPGNGSSTLTLSAAAGTIGGSYMVTVTGSGGGITKTTAVALTVVGPTFTMAAAATVIVARGGSLPLLVSVAGANGFASAVALSVSGLPRGVTGTFSPASIASPGSGSSWLTLKVASTTAKGITTLTVTGSGGGVTKRMTFSLSVQ